MRTILKLHHTKHTGVLLHHRHTSYRALFLLLALCGAFLLSVERTVLADDLTVTATVPAPLPSGIPVFTSPANYFITTEPSLPLEGTCPISSPPVAIVIYEGSSILGSSSCQSNGTFSLSVPLTVGIHTLTARVVNATNQTGASSAPLTITYTPAVTTDPIIVHPPQTTPVELTPSYGSPLLSRLDIVLPDPFIVLDTTRSTTLRATIIGGSLPYNATIDWGDGTREIITITDNTQMSFSHTYKDARAYDGSLTITDASGTVVRRDFAILSLNLSVPSTLNVSLGSQLDQFSNNPANVTILIYSSAVVIVGVLWFYEHMFFASRIGLPLRYSWQSPSGRSSRK